MLLSQIMQENSLPCTALHQRHSSNYSNLLDYKRMKDEDDDV